MRRKHRGSHREDAPGVRIGTQLRETLNEDWVRSLIVHVAIEGVRHHARCAKNEDSIVEYGQPARLFSPALFALKWRDHQQTDTAMLVSCCADLNCGFED